MLINIQNLTKKLDKTRHIIMDIRNIQLPSKNNSHMKSSSFYPLIRKKLTGLTKSLETILQK
jgi:hypothetical protein